MPVTDPVPPIAPGVLLIFLLQVGLLLLVALVLGRVATRFGMPALVGELGTGVLLGPSLLGHVAPEAADWLLPRDAAQFHLLDAVGQLGVLLLVGITGMHVDLDLIKRKGATAVRISVAGLVVPLLCGVAAGMLLPASLVGAQGDRTVFALFLGVALCVSAIPVIAKTLMDMNLLHREVGQLTLAAGTIDDVFGWLMLSVVSAMATTGLRAGSVAVSLIGLAVFVALAVTVGRRAVGLLLRPVARAESSGPAVAAVVVMLLGGAAVTHAVGLEAVFGAFVLGILIGRAPGFDLARLAPLRTVVLAVLAPIFFATAGLRMDLTALRDPVILLAALAVVAIAIAGKFVGAFAGALSSRLTSWEALALGAGMNARGVIEVIVAMVGLRLGVLNTAGYTILILVAVITSLMAPPLLRLAMTRVADRPGERERALRAVSS
ncbi:cation:proton antiporter [Nonomuraea sp. K274]|uniref:Cation:proton antiporter n=1 Tax=Nonomuraea cypriaca TaxID=1187855 RepID=A0A931APC6_9ACTN|nr:cation:proton antiporter [Nonomuraea cypriaca]MBF8194283.1 cation:proton antiporter [Nonomuraea cypriaca]